ncbi:MAG: Smr/MutS family protein [Rhodospirillaceae bacterium]
MTDRPRDRKNHDDDAALWAQLTDGVTPLPGRRQKTDAPLPPPVKPKALKRARPAQPLPTPLPALPPSAAAELTHGRAPGLDRRTQTNLRRGKLDVEGKIDLHGLTQTEAHRALIAFLTNARNQGKRAVIVVTGKGLKETGEVGVLRKAVPGWLNAPPLKPMIHAFDYAARQHGGEGALYVLLKRDKKKRDGGAA